MHSSTLVSQGSYKRAALAETYGISCPTKHQTTKSAQLPHPQQLKAQLFRLLCHTKNQYLGLRPGASAGGLAVDGGVSYTMLLRNANRACVARHGHGVALVGVSLVVCFHRPYGASAPFQGISGTSATLCPASQLIIGAIAQPNTPWLLPASPIVPR